jgi:hypothetical protein
MTSYVPDRGDLVWLEFTPQAGKKLSQRAGWMRPLDQ